MNEYLPEVVEAAGSGALRTYGTYWTRMATAWGDRPLDEITASELEALQRTITATALRRRTSRNGRNAGEHLAAARAVYNRAIADGHIDPLASPAHRVAKPRRNPSTRRALSAHELEDINATARSCGNDVILDALLLRLHTETACRRGGALAINLEDLDPDYSLVQLHEKGSTVRWQPITPALTNCLVNHATARGAVLPGDQLLRYRNARPITTRRYDNLWKRLSDRLPESPPKASPPTGSATPPSPGSNATSDTASPAPTPATPTPPDQPPPPTSKPTSRKSPPPSPP